MVFLSSTTSFALAEEHGTVTFELYLKKLEAADFLLLAKIEWYSISVYMLLGIRGCKKNVSMM